MNTPNPHRLATIFATALLVCSSAYAATIRLDAPDDGAVTLLTDASAPLSLTRGRTIVGNGYDLDIYDDTVTTVIIMK